MLLKSYPSDVPVGVLVQQSFIMLQSTLMRVQELIDRPDAPISDADRAALTSLIECLNIAKADAESLQKKMRN